MTLLDKQHEVIAGVVLVGITKSDLSYMYSDLSYPTCTLI